MVTGFGKINDRPASLIAYDFTVMAGSMGRTAEVKCNRAREIALTKRMPMIWLIDSAGARIQEAIGSTFAQSGFLFREESIMSGVVPMVAAMMGPGAAGTAYIPALSDFVPMVKGTSHMALGGPPLVKAVVGEDITPEELGGSKVHTEISGVADLEVADDAACIDAIKEYLEVLGGGRSAVLDDFRTVRIHSGGSSKAVGGRLARQDKGHAAELAAFIDAVRHGRPSTIDPDAAAHVTRVTFAAAESVRTGLPVHV